MSGLKNYSKRRPAFLLDPTPSRNTITPPDVRASEVFTVRNWNALPPTQRQEPSPEEQAELYRKFCNVLWDVYTRFEAPKHFPNGSLVEPARVLDTDPVNPMPGVVLRVIPDMFAATESGEDKGVPGYLVARMTQDYDGAMQVELMAIHGYRLQDYSGPRPQGNVL